MIEFTTATLFTSAAAFEFGAKSAGFRPLWGVEVSLKAAEFAEANHPGVPVIVDDVCRVDYSTLSRPWHLHASPSCKNASQANQGTGETQEDIDAARAIVRAIEKLRPIAFTLENVYGYRKFKSFRLIVPALWQAGYEAKWWHLNAADYGVPQTRKRLVLIARRDGRPVRKPAQTHIKRSKMPKDPTLFDSPLLPWSGWYAATEDLLPFLDETDWANWQKERLERLPEDHALFAQGGFDGTLVRRKGSEPAVAITANGGLKAFIVAGDNTSSGVVRLAGEPYVTVTASNLQKSTPRAFIVDVQHNSGSNGLTIRAENEPVFTIVSSDHNKQARIALPQGKTTKINLACLRRFQSLPDDFHGDHTAVGNAVPPLLARRIMESLR